MNTPVSSQMGDALHARLVEAERSLQLLRKVNVVLAFAAVAGLALGAIALAAAAPFSGSSRTLAARGVVLEDVNGVRRGSWSIAEDGATTLFLQDRNGVPRMKLSVQADGAPGVSFTDPKGRTRIALGFLPDETGTLVFADENGGTRTVLGVSPDQSATLVFVDANGATRAGLGVDPAGNPSFTLYENAREAPAPADTSGTHDLR